jgi:hypothetical protein
MFFFQRTRQRRTTPIPVHDRKKRNSFAGLACKSTTNLGFHSLHRLFSCNPRLHGFPLAQVKTFNFILFSRKAHETRRNKNDTGTKLYLSPSPCLFLLFFASPAYSFSPLAASLSKASAFPESEHSYCFARPTLVFKT